MTTTSTTRAPAPSVGNNDLIYQLDDRPAFAPAIFAALQHVLASFVGIITPTLIVGNVLGLGAYVPYLVSMALFVSGLGTFVQAKRIGPVGSGLLCLQGTSFAFLSAILSAGFLVKGRGGSEEEILATLFGVCVCAAFVEIAFSQVIARLRKIVTPVVTGTIICLIGLSPIKYSGHPEKHLRLADHHRRTQRHRAEHLPPARAGGAGRAGLRARGAPAQRAAEPGSL